MGKIFGISDLPVSTIDKAIRINGDFSVPTTVWREVPNGNMQGNKNSVVKNDIYTPENIKTKKSFLNKLIERFNRHK